MKKRHKKEELTMIDLNERGKIKIIHSSNKEVSKNDMQKFENKLLERFNAYCSFTNLCINKNKEKNNKTVSEQDYMDAMNSMLDHNNLLKNMINVKE